MTDPKMAAVLGGKDRRFSKLIEFHQNVVHGLVECADSEYDNQNCVMSLTYSLDPKMAATFRRNIIIFGVAISLSKQCP